MKGREIKYNHAHILCRTDELSVIAATLQILFDYPLWPRITVVAR